MILRQQCYQVGIRKIRGLGWGRLSRPTGRRQPKIVAEALESPKMIIARETAGAPIPPRGCLLSINISKIDVFWNSSINEPPRFIIYERNMSNRRISNNYRSYLRLLWLSEVFYPTYTPILSERIRKFHFSLSTYLENISVQGCNKR